jgi:hypothetical protein
MPMDGIGAGAHHMFTMNDFDYAASAEAYRAEAAARARDPVTYRRFARGAEAIRFAMEECPVWDGDRGQRAEV